jgi:hypothetical protein
MKVFFLRIGLLKHKYNPILVLCVKRILFFTNGLIKTGTTESIKPKKVMAFSDGFGVLLEEFSEKEPP